MFLLTVTVPLAAIGALSIYRIYRAYMGGNLTVIVLATFKTYSVINIAHAFALVIQPQVSVLPVLGCSWTPTETNFVLQIGNIIALCIYDTVLLLLALYSIVRDRGLASNFDTLWAILMRDNVLYFIM
ncbi:hypothetical protein CONPUDRAFT_74506 [Coniophora puteana RWD-64-598 SS2]|uniref:Uncharacterized protein n=1 Tax=Coniophora puteana (strain RWD-64-598) TaxID=741705 RepID=A0A5M3MJ51_CONPW|nr:uncharacterized protein CONPUDRAFT_74506 [Coniophora puteana RWD-64-598 SS2]EIW78950.1 hypothetical protein CONPUDRAFT_74506 [Coniophora puteana RWD-64-598 SS2]